MRKKYNLTNLVSFLPLTETTQWLYEIICLIEMKLVARVCWMSELSPEILIFVNIKGCTFTQVVEAQAFSTKRFWMTLSRYLIYSRSTNTELRKYFYFGYFNNILQLFLKFFM